MPLFGPPNVDRLKVRGDAPGLIKALEYPRLWRVRRDAAAALGQIGDADAVGPLRVAVEDQDSNVRRAAAAALATLGWQPTGAKSKT